MKKKTPVLLLVLILLAAAAMLPKALPVYRTCKALGEFLAQKEPAMDLSAQITLGESNYCMDAALDWVRSGDRTVTVLSQNGRAVYYCNGILYLENARAYRLTEPTGADFSAWKGAAWLLRNAKVEVRKAGCTVRLQGQQAQEMLSRFCPGAEDFVPEVDSLSLELEMEGNTLSKIQFRGNAWLGNTKVSLNVSLQIEPSGRKKTIPAAVDIAIRTGDTSQAEPLTENGLRLFSAFLALEEQESLCGALTLSADCGPLALDKTLDLFCWQVEGKRIYSLQENGTGLYYGNGSLCDGQGHSLSLTAENASAAKLPEMLLALCLRLTADCQQSQGKFVYRFTLDGDAMEELTNAIAPEAEKLPISLETGTLELVLAQDRIQSLNIRIQGSLSVLVTKVDVAIGAEGKLLDDTAPALPEAVKGALVP